MTSHEAFPKQWAALGVVFLSILLPYFFASFFIDPSQELVLEDIRIYLFLGELFIIAPSLLYLYRKKFDISRVYRLKPISFSLILWSFFFGIGISIIGDELDRLISYFTTPPDWLTQSMEFFIIESIPDALLIIGAIVVIAPLAEELLFRGFLQTTLEYRTQNVTRAILLTALAFAVLHMNTWWIIQIYIFGVALSYLSWRSQSVYPGILTHMGINGWSILLTNLDAKDSLGWYQMGTHVSPVWILAGGILLYLSIVKIHNAFPLHSRRSETIDI